MVLFDYVELAIDWNIPIPEEHIKIYNSLIKKGDIMSKRIYISPSNQIHNIYATGNTNEKEQCHKIAKSCFDYLVKNGFNVRCTYNDNCEERVKESNEFNADIHLAIHTNATVKHSVTGGTQILIYSLNGERYDLAKEIFETLSPLTPGTSAEKIIAKPTFYEINSAKGITIYCECEFHDTKQGSDFIIKNTKQIGEAIAKGICKHYGVETEKADKYYTVQVGAFKSKSNAQNLVKKLQNYGLEAFIKEV